MKWFINLKTGSKLLVAFGLIIVVMGIAMVTAYRAIVAIEQSQRVLFEQDFIVVSDLLELRADQNRQRGLMLEMLLSTDQAGLDTLEQDIQSRTAEINQLLTNVEKLTQDDSAFSRKLDDLKATLTAYRQGRDRQITLIREGKVDEARQAGIGVQDERFEKIRAISIELSDAARDKAKAGVTAAEANAEKAMRVIIGVGLGALVLGLVLVGVMSRMIAGPLQTITSAAERIAVGDLGHTLATDGRTDEVGLLGQSFARMNDSLKGMAGVAGKIAAGDLRVEVRPQSDRDELGNAFAAMVKNLRRVTADLTEGVNVLGSAAAEISTTTSQFAASAVETASAVSQTTTTVEEVRQTAQVSSDKARAVADTAQRAVQISQTGRRATEETAEGMNRIRQQMEAIAESMVRLSEQSQAIGHIVATVEDLAAQSNLLAVNASIEAAKAGEHGKGFAVVAQEVKSLAEQSKQATAQVRGMLNDIQKATTAAVMATEQGSKAVEMGVKQSSQAGQSIQTLTGSVTEAAQASAQIAASSQQQLVGVDQVASAMESIKQASTQNADSARQLEGAARNLKDLGQKLKLLVERHQM